MFSELRMSKMSFQELDIKMEPEDKENLLYLVVHTHTHTTNIVAMWCIKKIFSCTLHNLPGFVAIQPMETGEEKASWPMDRP